MHRNNSCQPPPQHRYRRISPMTNHPHNQQFSRILCLSHRYQRQKRKIVLVFLLFWLDNVFDATQAHPLVWSPVEDNTVNSMKNRILLEILYCCKGERWCLRGTFFCKEYSPVRDVLLRSSWINKVNTVKSCRLCDALKVPFISYWDNTHSDIILLYYIIIFSYRRERKKNIPPSPSYTVINLWDIISL